MALPLGSLPLHLMTPDDLDPAATQSFCRLGPPNTKVVATIGPACEERIGELVDAGMSVARLNCSHGTLEDHERRIQAIRKVSKERGIAVGILVDISGPKLRLGTFPTGKVRLRADQLVRIVEGNATDDDAIIPCNVKGFCNALQKGHRVFLADGVVELVIEETGEEGVMARMRRGGWIGDKKGVHLPDSSVLQEVPTEKDRADLAFAAAQGVDMIGVSYVCRAEELHCVRELVPEAMIVAKIERAAALERIDDLLEAADGIMVARGDLGVEVDLEHLPLVQKALIQSAMKCGKFTITATEMLESMVTSARPTRAEVADVANAILDGTDAVMLSAETAVGDYPVDAVEMMRRIAGAVEGSRRYQDLPRVGFRASEPDFSNATALAAANAADALGLAHIVCFTETGNTVRLLSRYRPNAEVIALTPHPRALSRMSILAHVRPLLFARRDTLESMLYDACRMLVERKVLMEGEHLVFVAGVPPGRARSTNVMKLHRVGELIELA